MVSRGLEGTHGLFYGALRPNSTEITWGRVLRTLVPLSDPKGSWDPAARPPGPGYQARQRRPSPKRTVGEVGGEEKENRWRGQKIGPQSHF